jgi:DnaJ-class molecular chaperone
MSLACYKCRGSGLKNKHTVEPEPCAKCKGSGVRDISSGLHNNIMLPPGWRKCRQCGRSGKELKLFMGKKGKPVKDCQHCQCNKIIQKEKHGETISICVSG